MSQVIYKTPQGENGYKGSNMASEYTEEFILITPNVFLSFNFEWSFDHVTFRSLNWGTTKKIIFFFRDRVTYSPGCLRTYSIAKDYRLELLIFPPLLPKPWENKRVPFYSANVAKGSNPGLCKGQVSIPLAEPHTQTIYFCF